MQQWHRYAVSQAFLDRYQREGNDFLGRIVAMDETWAYSYKPNLKRQSYEWKRPGSPHPEKVCPTQCAVKVMFIVVYDIDGLILHHAVPPSQMVNAAYYCTFLHHHLRPMLRRKWHLVVQEPHHYSWQGMESYLCCCHGSLALLSMGDSGTSTILTQYESMQLWSLHQSERTTARDPVQHKRWTYPCHKAVNTEYQQRWTCWWCMTPSKHLARSDK